MKKKTISLKLLLSTTILNLLFSSPCVSALHDSEKKIINTNNEVKTNGFSDDILSPAFYMSGNMRVNSKTGVPLAIYKPEFIAVGETYEEKARNFLIKNRHSLLKFDTDRNLNDLQYVSEQNIAGVWTTIRYAQVADVSDLGFSESANENRIPVYGVSLSITIDNKDDKILFMNGNYQKGVHFSTRNKDIDFMSSADVVQKTISTYSVSDKFGDNDSPHLHFKHYESKQVVFHSSEGTRLAWQVDISPLNSYTSTQIVFDAISGEIILDKDVTLDKRGKDNRETGNYRSLSNNLRSKSDKSQKEVPLKDDKSRKLSFSRATGTGNIFNPDPISSGKGKYGEGGFEDTNDRDTSDLTSQLVEVDLKDITFRGGKYHLEGPYAQIVDVDAPYDGTFSQRTNDFRGTRESDEFEAVMCYYHVDNLMRYINKDLGLSVMPTQYTGGVKCDPHAAGGADNSYYSHYSGTVHFGEGGVDDAEDSHVILHELGHALHDFLTLGGLSQVEGLSEGFGDYVAMSYSRSLNLWSKSEDEYDWVFPWDGHNQFWGGRRTNYEAVYPSQLTTSVHKDGQIWSSSNMKVWEALGREKSDKIHFLGLSTTSASSNQNDVANAIVQAAFSLEYDISDIMRVVEIYQNSGYSVKTDACGNDEIGTGEECDGENIGEVSCADIGCSAGGAPTCTDRCVLDYSSCQAGANQLKFELNLLTDEYGHETTWTLQNDEEAVVSQGGPFDNLEHHNTQVCVPAQENACYLFQMEDSYGDGIGDNGNFQVLVNSSPVICELPFTFELSYDICMLPPSSVNETQSIESSCRVGEITQDPEDETPMEEDDDEECCLFALVQNVIKKDAQDLEFLSLKEYLKSQIVNILT